MMKAILESNAKIGLTQKEMSVLKETFPACFGSNGSFDIARFKEYLFNKVNVTNEGYELRFLGKNYAKLGIYSSHTIPYAWDYAFEQNDFFYVYITLIDGAQIYGLYHFNSFASSEPDDRDIFLEKVFDVTTENDIVELKERINTKGMLIRGNQISSIEFLK